jgi:hypothetical protein
MIRTVEAGPHFGDDHISVTGYETPKLLSPHFGDRISVTGYETPKLLCRWHLGVA